MSLQLSPALIIFVITIATSLVGLFGNTKLIEHCIEINRIEGASLIPLGDLLARASELDTADEIVAYCLMGSRSAEACRTLNELGFAKVRNLKGGIRAWIEQVDPTQPNY